MAVEESLRLRRDATLERTDAVRIVRAGFSRMALGAPEPATDAALDLLRNGGATELELARAATEAAGEAAVLPLQMLLRKLIVSGWLQRTVVVDGTPVATARPLGHRGIVSTPLDASKPLALSRFALIRLDGGETVAESPRAAVQVVLHDPSTVALLATFAHRRRPDAVDAPRALIQLLADAAILADAEQEEALALWSFHDLLFHARSRFGRHVGGFGGTYRFDTEPQPAVKPATGTLLELPVPDLDRADLPLVQAMEQRRSVRRHDDNHAIDAAQLGELLYRCARVRGVFSDEREELSSRPYPAGGSIYELEIYPLVRLCSGVEPGLYRYDPALHALEHVAEPGAPTQTLLEFARVTSVMDAPPQVVLLITTRYGRIAWKYESIPYALTLKHVGALYQSLYLVATSLGLAPCAQGGGDPDAFATASGIGYYDEPTVGEFAVGSCA